MTQLEPISAAATALGDLSFPAFEPRPPWRGADLQTLRNFLRGPITAPPAGVRRERLALALDDGSGDVLSALLEHPAAPRVTPLVVLVHGLGGDETSAYMQATAGHLLGLGHRVLRLNLRGAGPSRPTCRQQYHAGRTDDLRDALAALPAALRAHGFVLVGYSLGGNMLLKFLADHATGDEPTGVRAAVSVSAPIDLAAASNRILEPRNKVYHWRLLGGMKREALAEGAVVSDEERRILPKLASILEFDEHIVAPRNGFSSAADYYARCHARRYLPDIRVPTLVVHALDDPWIPGDAYSTFDWTSNPWLTPLLPAAGGHVGFHGRGSRVPWHDRCVERLLEAV